MLVTNLPLTIFRIGITSERGFFGGWDVDYVLVSEYTNEDEDEDENKPIDQDDENVDELKKNVVWKFVASTTLDEKQNFIDLYSVTELDVKDESKHREEEIEEPKEMKPSGESSPSKGFKIGVPKIGFSWKTKPEKKEPGDNENEEDVIVPEEELGVESELVEKDPDLEALNKSADQKTDKNWKFGLPRFSLGRKGTSTQGENADDGDNKDVQEVLETLPADIDVGEDDREKKKYVVKVKTSDNFTAGTSSDVYVYLYGENGDSSKFG